MNEATERLKRIKSRRRIIPLFVQKKTEPDSGLPPSMFAGKLKLERGDGWPRLERHLVAWVYDHHGPSRFTVQTHPGRRFRTIWRGFIKRDRNAAGEVIRAAADRKNDLKDATGLEEETSPERPNPVLIENPRGLIPERYRNRERTGR